MAKCLPHFLGDMRCHRGQKPGQRFDAEPARRIAVFRAVLQVCDGVGKRVELCHRLVEAESLDILGNCLDGPMRRAYQIGRRARCRHRAANRRQIIAARHAVKAFQKA